MNTEATYNNPDEIFPSDLKERYHEARLIGKGGMGRVFKAHDVRLQRDVAIKLLPASHERENAVIRFQQEAKAVSKLNNPHIVKVQDFGFTEVDLEPFLVMEFIDGVNLADFLEKNGTLSLRRAIEIGIEVCEGLSHAHKNGILHRDLKPGNIMIDANNCVRILDFGLAKILRKSQDDTEQALTKPGRLMGSVLFMSPEQFEGKEASELSEIYSLGLVLFNLVTGEIPNQGENLMAFMRKRREEAPHALPETIVDPLRVNLNLVLQTALATDSADRFSSIDDFQNALRHCLSEETKEVGASHTDVPSVTKPERKTTLLQWAVATAIALIAVGSFAMYSVTKTPNDSHSPEQSKQAGELKDGGLPPGFLSERDENVDWWTGTTVKDEDLEKLIGSDIRNLSLQGNTIITDAGLHRIRNLKLVALNLRDTKISDASIQDIDNFKLTALNIRSSKITEEGILRMTANPSMKALDLKYLPISDSGLAHIVSIFPNLESLNVGFTGVNKDGQHLEILRKLKHLKRFFAEQINMRDADVDTLVSLKIQSMELAANPITRQSIEKLLTLPRLDFLSLAGCKGISAEDVAKLKSRFPDITLTEPVHKKTVVNDDVTEMFKQTDL
ncbi:protein kinase [Candidatus Obscuribacterales bacterium]|nr:protein kinase [Candidatus Obscuribacterales bacterium]